MIRPFDNKDNSFFRYNYDVYKLAPIVGFLYQRKADVDSGTTNTKIFGQQMLEQADDFKFNFSLIMLLDKKYEPDVETRVQKAFRGNITPEDEALYESYVRGGIDLMYEKLVHGVTSVEDYPNRLYDFLEDFNDRYNSEVDIQTALKMCGKIKT